ncbi:MAG: ferrous iron transport protein A [Planctomycetota bacterium]
MTMRSLATIGTGVTVLVVEVGECTTRARLAHRGILPGALITLVRDGDPLIVGIDDARFALSRHDATCILTMPLADAAPPPSSPLPAKAV